MTICPIAVVASCARCPVFRICPVKTLIGDVPKAPPASEAKQARPKGRAK